MSSLRELPGAPEVSSNSISTDFCSQQLWGLISLALESGAGGPGVGPGLLTPKIPLPNFYPPPVGVGPFHSAPVPLPLLPSGWMWFLLFHSCQTSIQLDFWQFWVMAVLHFSCNFDVVVQRGKLRLPMPPS